MMKCRLLPGLFLYALVVWTTTSTLNAETPQLVGDWWTVAGNPDLQHLGSEKQQPVDFGIWQAADGTWQLWSCIRHTQEPGKTRLFYRWESNSRDITQPNWQPRGIAMRADPQVGETAGGLQAPHVVREGDRWHMFYGDWQHICHATSQDGKNFQRVLQGLGKVTALFDEQPHANTRDPMLLRIGETWHCYYTAMLDGRGSVFCRSSSDFVHWSESREVAFGGRAGRQWWHAECPHVVERNGQYYLFRTQNYQGKPRSCVYRSTDPWYFGVDDDTHFVCELPVAAPEIVLDDDQYYLAALNPQLDGIRITRLTWDP